MADRAHVPSSGSVAGPLLTVDSSGVRISRCLHQRSTATSREQRTDCLSNRGLNKAALRTTCRTAAIVTLSYPAGGGQACALLRCHAEGRTQGAAHPREADARQAMRVRLSGRLNVILHRRLLFKRTVAAIRVAAALSQDENEEAHAVCAKFQCVICPGMC